jgi:hypothetical protein
MPLPDAIPVRFIEEEAGYITVRPVARQTFHLAELTDMVVSVTGKDAPRVSQIFRAGSVTYNGYRYWWQGFSAEPGEVVSLLASFPDDDASRPFRPEEATGVILESGAGIQHPPVELSRRDASLRRFLRPRSAWDSLLDAGCTSPPSYDHYSHVRRADLFRRELTFVEGSRLLQDVLVAAPRALRRRIINLPPPTAIVFLCPRAAQPRNPGS